MVPAVEALVGKAGRDDQYALDLLMRPLLQPAYRLAYMLLQDRESAEDAVQEAALKSWRKLSQFRPESDLLPWFLGFVTNECRNLRRSRWRNVIKLGNRDDLSAPQPTAVSDPDLQRALARLSAPDRAVVLLYFYLDMTVEEIGVATRSRPAAVRSRLYRAIKRLRLKLAVEETSQ